MKIFNFIGRKHRTEPSASTHSPLFCGLEALEERMFLSAAPRILSIYADNRGKVIMTANKDLDPSTLTTQSVVMKTAGDDATLGTSDDVKVTANVSYKAASRKIVLKAASLTANTSYRILVKANLVTGTSGLALDGEFTGEATKSGDKTPGGNYKCKAEFSTDTTTQVRLNTTLGTMDLTLFNMVPDVAITVNNFLGYVNRGDYDGAVFHRAPHNAISGPSVIQGGGFRVGSDGQLEVIPTQAPIPLEIITDGDGNPLPQSRLTLAMARTSEPNSATDQFYINTEDNVMADDYAIFGVIDNSVSDVAVMDSIWNLPRKDNCSLLLDGNLTPAVFNNVPVLDASGGTTPVDPANMVQITRAAAKMTVASM